MMRWLDRFKPRTKAQAGDEFERARALLEAIDRGGLPLMPSKINDIARDLGLEVSRKAPLPETIERVRAALARHEEK